MALWWRALGHMGVITIGQLLGMAAHLEGKASSHRSPLAWLKRVGATWSHVRLRTDPEAVYTTRVGMAEADLIMGCDPIVAAIPAPWA